MRIVAVKKRDTSKCLDNNLKHLQIINYESASQLYMEGFHDDPFALRENAQISTGKSTKFYKHSNHHYKRSSIQ